MQVAAVTMAYNEPVWAPVWVRHYAGQVGAAHCHVLDHGSTDGSLDGLGVRVERLGRSALDEDWRAGAVGEYVAWLLRRYDAVVHSDVDELVLADPRRHADLRAYAARMPAAVVTAAGLDLQHLPDEEAALDPARPIGAQRRWVRFSGAMCKPALVRRPVRWRPGFHGCDAPPVLDALFLVHLRYADLASGLRRLARTRAQAFARTDANPHQRVPDPAFEAMMRAIAALPRRVGELAVHQAPLSGWLARMAAGWGAGDAMLSLAGDELWALPDALRAALG